MSIDWSATLSFFADIATIVAAIVAVAAFVIAWRELNNWKHQVRSESQYKVASRVMFAVYEWRKSLDKCYEKDTTIRIYVWQSCEASSMSLRRLSVKQPSP